MASRYRISNMEKITNLKKAAVANALNSDSATRHFATKKKIIENIIDQDIIILQHFETRKQKKMMMFQTFILQNTKGSHNYDYETSPS